MVRIVDPAGMSPGVGMVEGGAYDASGLLHWTGVAGAADEGAGLDGVGTGVALSLNEHPAASSTSEATVAVSLTGLMLCSCRPLRRATKFTGTPSAAG
jgi:hypothetical protein